MKIKYWNPIYVFNANKMLEELPDKILSALSKEERDIFAKLAKNRTLYLPNPKEMFIFIRINSGAGISIKDIDMLKEAGLITVRSLNLKNWATLICRNRGWRISWNDKDKIVNVIMVTKLGKEVANRVEQLDDEKYVNSVISFFNREKIDVELIAVSNFNGVNLSFKHESLGFYYHKV